MSQRQKPVGLFIINALISLVLYMGIEDDIRFFVTAKKVEAHIVSWSIEQKLKSGGRAGPGMVVTVGMALLPRAMLELTESLSTSRGQRCATVGQVAILGVVSELSFVEMQSQLKALEKRGWFHVYVLNRNGQISCRVHRHMDPFFLAFCVVSMLITCMLGVLLWRSVYRRKD